MKEFGWWYCKHFFSSYKRAYSLQKSIPSWIFFFLSLAAIAALFAPTVSERAKELEGPLKLLIPAIVFVVLVIVLPLWFAFEESKEKDEKIKDLADKIDIHPVIRIDDLHLDERFHENYRILEMRVKNDGTGEVVGRVFAVRIEDKQGERIERIDKPIEIHWRGVSAEEQQKFFGNGDAHACVLIIDKNNPDAYFSLVPPSPHGQEMRLAPLLTPPIMSYRSEEIFFTVRVIFYDTKDGRAIADKERRFSIKPDTASKIGYQVCPV